jgi:hypothetical protein
MIRHLRLCSVGGASPPPAATRNGDAPRAPTGRSCCLAVWDRPVTDAGRIPRSPTFHTCEVARDHDATDDDASMIPQSQLDGVVRPNLSPVTQVRQRHIDGARRVMGQHQRSHSATYWPRMNPIPTAEPRYRPLAMLVRSHPTQAGRRRATIRRCRLGPGLPTSFAPC